MARKQHKPEEIVSKLRQVDVLVGRKAGPSTGTNLWGTLIESANLIKAGKSGAVVTLMCDSGDRYLDTYYNSDWVREHIGDITPYQEKLDHWPRGFAT